MKMYDYLLAYQFTGEGYLTPCSGTIQVSLNKKIKTFDHINELCQLIKEKTPGASNVSIYNIILLGRNRKKNNCKKM